MYPKSFFSFQADELQRRQVNILEMRLNKLKIRDAEAEHHNEKYVSLYHYGLCVGLTMS